ncbi:MAG: hypothetical protein ACRCY9_08545 [Phycicoccus sp.]
MADIDRRRLLAALSLTPAALVLSGCPVTGNEDDDEDGGGEDEDE